MCLHAARFPLAAGTKTRLESQPSTCLPKSTPRHHRYTNNTAPFSPSLLAAAAATANGGGGGGGGGRREEPRREACPFLRPALGFLRGGGNGCRGGGVSGIGQEKWRFRRMQKLTKLGRTDLMKIGRPRRHLKRYEGKSHRPSFPWDHCRRHHCRFI